MSNNDRSRQLRAFVPAWFRRTKSDVATVVVIDALATGTELVWVRALLHTVRGKAPGRTTTLAVPRPVLRAEAEEAAGREGAPGGDMVPGKTVEAETKERRQHRPLATSVSRGMAAATPSALNKREAIDVDRRSRTGDVVSR
jgi:hypothetical protein